MQLLRSLQCQCECIVVRGAVAHGSFCSGKLYSSLEGCVNLRSLHQSAFLVRLRQFNSRFELHLLHRCKWRLLRWTLIENEPWWQRFCTAKRRRRRRRSVLKDANITSSESQVHSTHSTTETTHVTSPAVAARRCAKMIRAFVVESDVAICTDHALQDTHARVVVSQSSPGRCMISVASLPAVAWRWSMFDSTSASTSARTHFHPSSGGLDIAGRRQNRSRRHIWEYSRLMYVPTVRPSSWPRRWNDSRSKLIEFRSQTEEPVQMGTNVRSPSGGVWNGNRITKCLAHSSAGVNRSQRIDLCSCESLQDADLLYSQCTSCLTIIQKEPERTARDAQRVGSSYST